MDRKSHTNPEILRLQERSEAARGTVGTHVTKLKRQLDVPARLRESLRGKPSTWILGSTVAGMAAGFLFPRFRRPAPIVSLSRKSAAARLLGLAWATSRPFLKAWLANQLRIWFIQRASLPSQPSQPPR
jgi:hypothetical protein